MGTHKKRNANLIRFHLESDLLQKIRWVDCPLPTQEAIKRGIRWKQLLVFAAIRHRNRKGKIPTQRRVAARLGMPEKHIKEHLDKLRAVGLLDPDELRTRSPDWDCFRRRKNGKPVFIRFPCPSPECPLSDSELYILSAYSSFPDNQNISSLTRLTGLDRNTIRKSLANLTQEPQTIWFHRRELPNGADPMRHRFNSWYKSESMPLPNRKDFFQAVKFFGEQKFYSLASRAKDGHKGVGSYARLLNFLLNEEKPKIMAARDQEKTIQEHSEIIERDRVEEAKEPMSTSEPPPIDEDFMKSLQDLEDTPTPPPTLRTEDRDILGDLFGGMETES